MFSSVFGIAYTVYCIREVCHWIIELSRVLQLCVYYTLVRCSLNLLTIVLHILCPKYGVMTLVSGEYFEICLSDLVL